jgi:hypothetical protein
MNIDYFRSIDDKTGKGRIWYETFINEGRINIFNRVGRELLPRLSLKI